MNHPYRDGVALIGDAAATSDPIFGQGLSLALRAARVLRDQLLANSDWDGAGHAYVEQHDAYFHNCHTSTVWFRQVFQEQSREAALRRQKALPLIAQDLARVPDHIFSGPKFRSTTLSAPTSSASAKLRLTLSDEVSPDGVADCSQSNRRCNYLIR